VALLPAHSPARPHSPCHFGVYPFLPLPGVRSPNLGALETPGGELLYLVLVDAGDDRLPTLVRIESINVVLLRRRHAVEDLHVLGDLLTSAPWRGYHLASVPEAFPFLGGSLLTFLSGLSLGTRTVGMLLDRAERFPPFPPLDAGFLRQPKESFQASGHTQSDLK
jgi:hypothetical protein